MHSCCGTQIRDRLRVVPPWAAYLPLWEASHKEVERLNAERLASITPEEAKAARAERKIWKGFENYLNKLLVAPRLDRRPPRRLKGKTAEERWAILFKSQIFNRAGYRQGAFPIFDAKPYSFAFAAAAREEIAENLKREYPDNPAAAEALKECEFWVMKRICFEVVDGRVPVSRRRYFFDPRKVNRFNWKWRENTTRVAAHSDQSTRPASQRVRDVCHKVGCAGGFESRGDDIRSVDQPPAWRRRNDDGLRGKHGPPLPGATFGSGMVGRFACQIGSTDVRMREDPYVAGGGGEAGECHRKDGQEAHQEEKSTRWLAALEAKGKNRESFLIKG